MLLLSVIINAVHICISIRNYRGEEKMLILFTDNMLILSIRMQCPGEEQLCPQRLRIKTLGTLYTAKKDLIFLLRMDMLMSLVTNTKMTCVCVIPLPCMDIFFKNLGHSK